MPTNLLPLVVQSYLIARTHRCLQPPGDQKALTELAGLWRQLHRQRQQQAGMGWVKYAAGGVCGALAGMLVGYAGTVPYPDVPWALGVALGAVLAGAGGGVVAHFFTGFSGSFQQTMMKLIINERRSVVRKAMVTDELEFWVPKALMLHRQHEWRRDRQGVTYMWLRLPHRIRILAVMRNMLDALDLPDDRYYMLDSAGKGQRVWDRLLAQNSQEFSRLDVLEEEKGALQDLMPHIIGAAMVVGGLIIAIVALS